MRKKLLRLMRIAPLALLFAGTAFAQTTSTILGVVTDASTGKPVPGAVIIATSPALQGEQTAVTGNDGSYRLTLLPPGEYKLAVQLDGFKPAERSDITLRTDKTIRANLAVVPEAVQMEEQVVRTGAAPVVNIGAAESGAVVSREFVASIPVGRSVEQVSTVVPTATADFYGVGFAGAQSPENSYILDGLNVTDPVYGTFGANPLAQNPTPTLLTNFIQELDVKTGSFMPEYGRATGGVLNMVTRSGSNEFHGSVFSNLNPRSFIQPNGQVTGGAGEAIAWRAKPDEGAYDLDVGFEVGGPIQKDKLWFYGGFAPIVTQRRTERFLRLNELDAAGEPILDANGDNVQTRVPGGSEIVSTGRTTYQFAGKLTYLFNENNNFTVSAFGMPSTSTQYEMNASPSRRKTWTNDSTYDAIGRYAGKFLDKRLIAELVGGWHGATSKDDPRTLAGVDQGSTPALEWIDFAPLTNFENVPGCTSDEQCPVQDYFTGGSDFINDSKSNRFAGRASLAYLFDAFGSHNTRAGVDLEYSTYAIRKRYGGNYWFETEDDGETFTTHRGYGLVSNPELETDVVDEFTTLPFIETNSNTTSTAVFLQDSWQLPVANVTLNYGVRWEGQNMKNSDNPEDNGFSINNNWAPRLQAIWDFTGNGRGKVAASWGRFFYMMPLDMGDRSFGLENSGVWAVEGCTLPDLSNGGATRFDPNNIALNGPGCALSGTITQEGGFTPVAPNLEGAYVDQFGGQAEYEIFSDLSVGVEYQGRRQGNIIEDMSADDGVTYYIGNPGTGDPYTQDGVTYDSKQVFSRDRFSGRDLLVPFPKPERNYNGYTLFARKNFSQNWLATLSYTYASLTGNYAGPFRPEDNQLDPGITAEYDLPTLMANRNGYLPGDRPHQVKLYGSYNFNLGPRFKISAGAGYTGQSGTPVTALGRHPRYGDGQAFLIPRGQAGRTPFEHNVDLRGSLEYVVTPPYAVRFTVDVFNVFNSQEIVDIDENYTFDSVLPVVGIKCSGYDAAGSSDPIAKVQQQCPDLAYMKTVDGRPVSTNPNFGKAAPGTRSFQVPLSMRFGVALSF